MMTHAEARCQAGSHSLVGCVDWNFIASPLAKTVGVSHSLVGCVDWNDQPSGQYVKSAESHSLVGCVDWNNISKSKCYNKAVALSCRVRGLKFVQEIKQTNNRCVALSCRVRGLKYHQKHMDVRVKRSHSLVGCVDWNVSLTVKETFLPSRTLL